MAEFAFQFWQRVDELRGRETLAELAAAIGVRDQSIRAMRSQDRYPKIETMNVLASHLGTTVDYLMTGKDSDVPKPPVVDARRKRIIQAVETASDLELTMVEKILGI